jgi:L-fuconolactonase
MIVDAHVHVFRPARVHPRPVDDALVPADRDAPVEDLIEVMAAVGVDRAVLVPLGPENDYVTEVLAAHPGRFAAVAVADPASQGRVPGVPPVEALRARLDGGFAGLRTQWLGEPGRRLAESPMLPVLRELAGRGLPLWSYLPPEQVPLLRELPEVVGDLTVVLNHLGFAPYDMRVDRYGRPTFADPFPTPVLDTVLGLAAHPRAYLMFSGQYALSREDPPYADLHEIVRRLAGAYGTARMLWASDYPWTRDVPGLARLLTLADSALPGLSAAERAAVHGGTAATLFPALATA